jgi:hypothetical protein
MKITRSGTQPSAKGPCRLVRAGREAWHGASPANAMQHLAIQEALDGKAVEWLEKVTDEQYQAAPKTG